MRNRTWRRLRVLTLVGIMAVGVLAAAWRWVMPALIVAEIRKHHEGYVSIRGWWIDRSSAGVTGLVLHESPSPASPVWARAESASTDLTLSGLLRGRKTPRRVTFRAPQVVYRIGEDGRALTRIPVERSKQGPSPTLIAERGRLTMAQAGRPPLIVGNLNGRLDTDTGERGAGFEVRSSDAGWGNPAVAGRFGPGFRSVTLRLTANRLPADADKTMRIPFVTRNIWSYFRPTGPVRTTVDYARPEAAKGTAQIKTIVDFEGTQIVLPHLQVVALDAVGRMIYEDRVVRFVDLHGAMVGGRVAVNGTMDFHGVESRYDLGVDVAEADVRTLPASWGISTIGLAGRLTGDARLTIRLTGRGLDMTGSAGSGTIDEASVRGIPLGRLGVRLRGDGLRADVVTDAAQGDRPLFLPQWLGSEFEVRDAPLEQAVARMGPSSHARDVPVSGRLSLKLGLRIPLGTLADVNAYCGEGTAGLSNAAIGAVRLGRLAARVGVSRGMLDVTDVRGHLTPRGGRDGSGGLPPSSGPLPAGAFRGRFRAGLAPNAPAEAELEGNALPLSAVAPTADGALSVAFRGSARDGSLTDPSAWSGSGRAEGREVVLRSTRLRNASARLALEHGRLGVSQVKATLDGRPFTGQGTVDLTAPHAFAASLDAARVPLADVLALASPSAAHARFAGTVAVRGEASGTLDPRRIESQGRARIDRAEAGPIPLGDVPLTWKTQGDTVVVTALELQRYGGRLAGEARVPVRGNRPVQGHVTLSHVDTAQLSAEVPGAVRLTGVADGQASFRLPMNTDGAQAEATLSASKMTVDGIPARSLRATLVVRRGVPQFEVRAEGLAGNVVVKGSGATASDGKGAVIDADVRAIGLQLMALWQALGASRTVTGLHGVGTVAAQVRSRESLRSLRATGTAEVRDLRWGPEYAIGHLGATFVVAPEGWRVGRLHGALWSSPVSGDFWSRCDGGDPPRYGLNLRLEHAALERALAFEPTLARRVEGFVSVTAQGHSEGSFRGQGELRVERGRFNHLPVDELSIPLDWNVRPENGFRGTVQVRKASARLAGGRLEGSAVLELGARRNVHAELILDDLDMRAISRAENRAGRPIPGRIDGIINVASPDAAEVRDYTGRIDLDLTDAALVDIPVLDRIDSALGSARGAVFDEGDLHARLANREIFVERLTLVGPLAQLHASGTIDADGRLDLRALVNTNNTVPENAQVAIGRFSSAAMQVQLTGRSIDRVTDYLARRLMKFHVSGTLAHPVYTSDGSMHVDAMAIAFFVEAMKLKRSGATR